jgi:GT2 family glycosyltransferase
VDSIELSQEVEGFAQVGVVIVTHNSEESIDQTLFALNQQTVLPDQVVLVDSGSSDSAYLKRHSHQGKLELCFMPNIGFSAGNNLGVSSLSPEVKYVLFLNPDVILPPEFMAKAIAWMEAPGREHVGAISGPLLGWDLAKEAPTGLIDSTGIFSTWYGKWFDRDRGASVRFKPFTHTERVPALCGALIFARKNALDSVKMGKYQVFDERFFCYKEDIDLSIRLRKKGWELAVVPELFAYHARGWNPSRKLVPRPLRVMSAENELRLHMKGMNPIKILYSLFKYIAVSVFDL